MMMLNSTIKVLYYLWSCSCGLLLCSGVGVAESLAGVGVNTLQNQILMGVVLHGRKKSMCKCFTRQLLPYCSQHCMLA